MLDLVALATVADVAPLIGANRAFVRQGLKVMARAAPRHLVALADVSRMDARPRPITWGSCWARGSMRAAASARPDLGARSAVDRQPMIEPRPWPNASMQLNTERRDIEAACAPPRWNRPKSAGWRRRWSGPQAKAGTPVSSASSLAPEGGHEPSGIVIGFDGDEGKGSGRSVSGVDLGAVDPAAGGRRAVDQGRWPQDGGRA